jgi:HEAT repeat protein
MRARVLGIGSLLFLSFSSLLIAQQAGTDKKGEPGSEQPKITADMEVQGKKLEQWIKLIPSKDRSMTKMAIEAILVYDPEARLAAVPAMVAELLKHKATRHIDTSVRATIPQPLALILCTAKGTDQQSINSAVSAFKYLLANDKQEIVQLRVVQAVADMGPMAKDIVPELAKAVMDPNSEDWELREHAALALGVVAFDDKAAPQALVVKALFSRLKESSEPAFKVRLAAIQSLNSLRVGLDPNYKKPLADAMKKVITDDPNPLCKLRADLTIYTLLDNATEKKARRNSIGNFLESHDHLVRLEAAQMLGYLGEDAKDQVPRLLKCLKDKDPAVVALSVVALAKIKDKKALDDLQVTFQDANMPEFVRATAKDAIDIIMGNKSAKDESKKGSGKQ